MVNAFLSIKAVFIHVYFTLVFASGLLDVIQHLTEKIKVVGRTPPDSSDVMKQVLMILSNIFIQVKIR